MALSIDRIQAINSGSLTLLEVFRGIHDFFPQELSLADAHYHTITDSLNLC